jgi:chemotaxis protein CheX
MELIQPFINAADAVLAQSLQGATRVGEVTMEEEAYRRKGVAAIITFSGDVEGRIIFDLEPPTAAEMTSRLMDEESGAQEELVREAVCEIANQVIGNAVTALNDQGFRFRVHPPQVHTAESGLGSTEDTEALVMCFETPSGKVFMNIAMRYQRRRRGDG